MFSSACRKKKRQLDVETTDLHNNTKVLRKIVTKGQRCYEVERYISGNDVPEFFRNLCGTCQYVVLTVGSAGLLLIGSRSV